MRGIGEVVVPVEQPEVSGDSSDTSKSLLSIDGFTSESLPRSSMFPLPPLLQVSLFASHKCRQGNSGPLRGGTVSVFMVARVRFLVATRLPLSFISSFKRTTGRHLPDVAKLLASHDSMLCFARCAVSAVSVHIMRDTCAK